MLTKDSGQIVILGTGHIEEQGALSISRIGAPQVDDPMKLRDTLISTLVSQGYSFHKANEITAEDKSQFTQQAQSIGILAKKISEREDDKKATESEIVGLKVEKAELEAEIAKTQNKNLEVRRAKVEETKESVKQTMSRHATQKGEFERLGRDPVIAKLSDDQLQQFQTHLETHAKFEKSNRQIAAQAMSEMRGLLGVPKKQNVKDAMQKIKKFVSLTEEVSDLKNRVTMATKLLTSLNKQLVEIDSAIEQRDSQLRITHLDLQGKGLDLQAAQVKLNTLNAEIATLQVSMQNVIDKVSEAKSEITISEKDIPELEAVVKANGGKLHASKVKDIFAEEGPRVVLATSIEETKLMAQLARKQNWAGVKVVFITEDLKEAKGISKKDVVDLSKVDVTDFVNKFTAELVGKETKAIRNCSGIVAMDDVETPPAVKQMMQSFNGKLASEYQLGVISGSAGGAFVAFKPFSQVKGTTALCSGVPIGTFELDGSKLDLTKMNDGRIACRITPESVKMLQEYHDKHCNTYGKAMKAYTTEFAIAM